MDINHLIDGERVSSCLELAVKIVLAFFQWIHSPIAKVEKDANFRFMLDYLATFTGNLPTQAEVQAMIPELRDTIHSLVCGIMVKS